MSLTEAPLFDDVTGTDLPGRAWWLRTGDGVRIRAAHWDGGDRGLVLIFPGRSEYIEKYGPAAAQLAARGYSSLVIDWRGQGLSQKLAEDPALGHVGSFADYQQDLQAVLDLVRQQDLPRPRFLLAHSMGGAIAMRALHQGLDVAAVCLSAPMLGINIAPALLPVAWGIGWASGLRAAGALRYVPGSSAAAYVTAEPFDDNLLTTDAEMYAFLRHQVEAHPELALGGPSVGWLYAALQECRWLARQPAPRVPGLCFLGLREKIVDAAAIRRTIAGWPQARLVELPHCEHEVMMETPALRRRFYQTTLEHFDTHRD